MLCVKMGKTERICTTWHCTVSQPVQTKVALGTLSRRRSIFPLMGSIQTHYNTEIPNSPVVHFTNLRGDTWIVASSNSQCLVVDSSSGDVFVPKHTTRLKPLLLWAMRPCLGSSKLLVLALVALVAAAAAALQADSG